MDYEKLHKETITKLQEMVNSGKITVETARGICADFIPESEDEKIRKAIINVFATHKDYEVFFGVSVKDIITWLKKQGENKPIDKVEPKFKVGDWITNKYGVVRQIVDVQDSHYVYMSDWRELSAPIEPMENSCRLWTIRDAKDGDVLCSNQIILLFRQWEPNSNCNFVIAHAGIDISGKLQITDGHWLISNESKLATQEQRDLLFSKMKEAGYGWNEGKKELVEIKQKSAWSEEDKENISMLIDLVESKEESMEVKIELSAWLKSLKERMQPQPTK